MKRLLILFLCCCFLSSCATDHESMLLTSPSSKLKLKTTVNRTHEDKADYGLVILHLYNHKDKKLLELNTQASDFSPWSVDWSHTGDTIVLKSSDLGSRLWVYKNNQMIEVKASKRTNYPIE